MNVQLPDPAHSRIVLIGTPSHARVDDRLPDVPVVANNVTDLAAVFTDPALGGFDARHCVTAAPNAGMPKLGELLTSAAEQAKDLLLIYYAGHGLLDRRGQLHLALAGTHPDQLGFTALPYETLRNVCLDSDAKSRVVILDSCYSGRAIGKPLAGAGQEIIGQLEISGTYTLTSAPANGTALFLPGEQHTAFTGRLLDLLRDGGPEMGDVLSMGEIYRHLHARLTADGLPAPQQRGTDTAGLLGLVRNRRPAPPRIAPLPEDIQEGLDSRLPRIRLAAVEELGEWLTHTEPAKVRAAVIALRNVADHDNPTVAGAAKALLAKMDLPPQGSPERRPEEVEARIRRVAGQAEVVAKAISTIEMRISVLAEVARTWATIYVAKARDVATYAEHAIPDSTDINTKLVLLADLAHAWATVDQSEARRVIGDAAAISELVAHDNSGKVAWAQAELARGWAAVDPDKALRVANNITFRFRRAIALAHVAQALAGVNQATAMVTVGEAEVSAIKLHMKDLQVEALSEVAIGWAGLDQVRARRVAKRAEELADDLGDNEVRMNALALVTNAWATLDPGTAEKISERIEGDSFRAQAKAAVARGWAVADPERAEAIAKSIPFAMYQAQALAQIARAWGENAKPR